MNEVLLGDVTDILPKLPSNVAHTCVTSPPYYALRDYKIEPTAWPEIKFSLFGMPITISASISPLGMEPSPMEFVGHMVFVFREVKRVLRDDGTCWVNMGDSYASISGGYDITGNGSTARVGKRTQAAATCNKKRKPLIGLKPKDMIGIPWMLAFALRDDGWYLRSDVIWSKPNPMPESVTDRPTKAHEYIFLLSKSEKYYYDHFAIKTPPKDSSFQRWDQNIDAQTQSARVPGKTNGNMKAVVGGGMKSLPEGQANLRKKRDGDRVVYRQRGHSRRHAGFNDRWDHLSGEEQASMGANKRTVWEVPTMPFKEAHFATFPESIPSTCIKAGTSQRCCATCGNPYRREVKPSERYAQTLGHGYHDHSEDHNGLQQLKGKKQVQNKMRDAGVAAPEYETIGWQKTCDCDTLDTKPCIVLEPFSGAGTTAMVARKLGRDYIAIEKKPEYKTIGDRRMESELGMFK